MSNDINLTDGTVLEVLNDKVDIDFGNVPSNSVGFARCSTEVTNCITEIPQRIKYSFSGSTLTIHAGSTAIIPNEFEEDGTTLKFDYWNTENDISLTVTGTKTDAFLCLKNTAYPTGWTSNTYSGTDTTTKSDTMCYRTDLNRIIYNNDTTQPNYSFPLLKFSYTDSVITGVSQVFNGMGYIGSTAWVDKEVKGLSPIGKNDNGSLKNNEVIKPRLSLCTTSATGKGLVGVITKASAFDGYRYIESETQPDDSLTHTLWYQPSTNLMKWHTTAQSGWATTSDVVVYGYYDRTNGVISNFKPKQPLRLVDYSQIDGQWVVTPYTAVVENVTLGANADRVVDLSNYLPNDGYFYQVNATISHVSAVQGSASITYQDNTGNVLEMIIARSQVANQRASAAGFVIVDANRQIHCVSGAVSVAQFYLILRGYRRLGNN